MPIKTRKQKLFIDYYVQLKNATEAAKRAGYSEKTAYAAGSRLLKDAEIKKEIERRFVEELEELNLTEQRIIEKLCYEAKEAPKASDRIRALEILAKIRGMLREAQNTQTIAIIEDITKKIKERIPDIAEKVLSPDEKKEDF